MLIKELTNADIASKKLGNDLSQKLISAKKTGQNVSLLLSGGSALGVLEYIGEDTLGDYLTIGMLDERFDSNNQNSNFIHLTKTKFFRRAKKTKSNFIDTSVKRNQTQKQLANYFEKSLRDWKNKNKNGIILATLGMGADGHIAGIMPFPENEKLFNKLFCGKNWVTSYDAANKNLYPLRVTTTITFLKLISEGFAYICGKEKAANLKKITSHSKISELPCRSLKQIKNLTIYTDIK